MEPILINSTSCPAEISALPETLSAIFTVFAKATFDIAPNRLERGNPKQQPLVAADFHTGDPGITAVRYESDFVPFKPRSDVLCVGKAYAPHGVPVTECQVRFGVGAWSKTVRVVGNRHWLPALGGLTHKMSEPEPFTSIPVSYEYAYGGEDAGNLDGLHFYTPNPVGKGYSGNGGGLNNLPLPNLEDPNDPIKSWRSRPRPMSFGSIGRTWEPRIKRVGTYDRRWLKERSPQLPEDFDEGYYNCAPTDQQIQGYLRGDEEIQVDNMHPQYPQFRSLLPGIRIRAFVDRKQTGGYRLEEILMNLDTLWVDMEALLLVLVWRGRFSMPNPDPKSTVLVVEEPLAELPHPPESYRPKLLEFAAEEAEADRTIEEAEKELAGIEAEQAANSIPAEDA